MGRKLVYESSFGRLIYDDKLNWVIGELFGLVNVELAMDLMKESLALIREHSCVGILTDFSELTGSFIMLNDNFEKEGVPEIIKAGCRYWSCVISPDIFTRFATKDLERRTKQMHVRMFLDRESAELWANDVVEQIGDCIA